MLDDEITRGLVPRWAMSVRSLDNLHTCDERLQQVVQIAASISPIDFTVLEGHRTAARQRTLYSQGSSTLDGVTRKSKHQSMPSLAVDLCPYPIDWQDTRRFYVLAGAVQAAAQVVGIRLRSGTDWDSDGSFKDQSFHDLPHFELVL